MFLCREDVYITAKTKKYRKLLKSAKSGSPDSLYRLGIYTYNGKYDFPDIGRAYSFIYASAQLGYKPAVDWIEDYYFDDDALTQSMS